MNIVYPTLVEQAYYGMLKRGYDYPKEEIYKALIEANLIDENGNPTQDTLDNNLVEECDSDVLKRFKAQYPIFMGVDDKYFTVTKRKDVLVNVAGIEKFAKTMLLANSTTRYQKKKARALLTYLSTLN